MDLVEQLQNLSLKTEKLCSLLQTEEATKNALIMPFIAALGYDIFDPTEVIPEFVADVGIKKGEKVDYAIVKDGKIIMLFECKHCGGDLNINHASQLFRYFSVTDARIAVLTNGLVYKFFTDLEAPNKMDEKPFFEFTMTELDEVAVMELKKLTKQNFSIDQIVATAGELKYARQIKKHFAQLLENPSDELVKLIASQVYSGVITPSRREYFAAIIKRAFNQLINDRINDRLKSAMSGASLPDTLTEASQKQLDNSDQTSGSRKEELVQTTAEELEGYYIVKSLLRDLVDPVRIIHRDTQSYMGILLDDNNRKPLARLHFNRGQKYLGIFDESRNEQRIAIQNINEIYQYADQLRRVFAFYEKENSSNEEKSANSDS